MSRNLSKVNQTIPRGVWVLGFVSMLMDVSSEMIHSLLPLFMVTVLGTSALTVGLIEGLAESTALMVKVFSGVLSDYLGRRKGLAVFGYALGALTKPLFAIATSSGMVLGARLLDRVGKGIRGAPRDALLADITPIEARGAAFGLRQSLDTVGAFVGPLLGVGLMLLWANDFRAVFWVALIPGLMAVALLVFSVHEPPRPDGHKAVNPIRRENLKRLGTAYWWVVGIGAVFTLARFSEAFLVLRADQGGIPIALVPLVMVAMNVIYAATAYPFGKLSDGSRNPLPNPAPRPTDGAASPSGFCGGKHASRNPAFAPPAGEGAIVPLRGLHVNLLAIGLAVLIAADLVLAYDDHWTTVLVGVALWGVHMGITQGLLARMVADAAPADLRGTAYGFFNLMSGLAMLVASVLAGLLWDSFGASWTFYAGASFCVIALAGLLWQPVALRDS